MPLRSRRRQKSTPEWSRRLLKLGKHVFVEKPLALRHAEGARLVGEAEKRSLVLMVGHLLQYHAAFIKMRTLVREGRLGPAALCLFQSPKFREGGREENISGALPRTTFL